MSAVRADRAWILLATGHAAAWDELRDLPSEAGSLDEARRLASTYGSLAHAAVVQGHHARAEAFLDRAERLSAEHADPYAATGRAATRVLIEWATGRWEGLERRAHDLLSTSTDAPVVCMRARLALGLVLLARGELTGSEHHLSRVRELATGSGCITTLVAADAGLARIRLARDDVDGAVRIADEGLDPIVRKGTWSWSGDIVPSALTGLVRSRRQPAATALVAAMNAGLSGVEAPYVNAALLMCRGAMAREAGRHDAAARRFGTAASAWAALPCPYQAALAREAEGLALLAHGDDRGADALLDALQALAVLEAHWDVTRVREALRSHGVAGPYPWRGGRRPFGNRLSQRELEIARLAAGGRTNREIADALVLSPRTVESHVASAMRKLGARSRTDLGPDRLPDREGG